jgi:hypothetical protein
MNMKENVIYEMFHPKQKSVQRNSKMIKNSTLIVFAFFGFSMIIVATAYFLFITI